MNFDPSLQLPTAFDITHLVLAGIAITLLILLVLKPSTNKDKGVASKNTDTDVTLTPAISSETPDKAMSPNEPAVKESVIKPTSPDSALQFLSLLQQEARMIDFIYENISEYSDEEVGAAARVVHEGSLKAINEYFTLMPIREEEEESRLTLQDGFNASEIRLTGNVVGSAPFSGTLIHRGWRAQEVKLPKISEGHDVTIIAAAEVEL